MNEIVKKNGVTYVIITGAVSILITTLIYITDLNLFTSMWIGLINILFYIVIGVILLSKTKKELKGVFPFKQAFTTYFISAVIGILMSVVFNIILFNYIDPSAKETIKELSIKYAVEMMEKFNTPSSAVKVAIAEMEKNDQFSASQWLKGSFFAIALSAVFGLILAAIFKTKTNYNE